MVKLITPSCLAGCGLSTFETCVEECGSTVRGLARGIKIENRDGDGDGATAVKPILVLLHGYPQTWRHVVKLLPKDSRLFIPDLPGYGYSSPSQTAHDKGTIGRAVLSALSTLLSVRNKSSISSTSSSTTATHISQPVILVGHDRGARIIHRLAVDYNTTPYTNTDNTVTLPFLGAVLMDIVPTITQWGGMSNSLECAGAYHWPLLANVEIATTMIRHMGPDRFVRDLINRGLGTGETSISNLQADGAMEAYERPFRQMESVVRATCQDYEAGAGVDVELQKRDLEQGEKIKVPVLVIYSQGIGRRFDVPEAWREWVEGGEERVSFLEMGEGVGHYVAEEDPERTVEGIQSWMSRFDLDCI